MRRGGPLQRKVGLRRGTKLRVEGKSTAAELKREIQRVARDIVIKRDGGCILRNITFFNGPQCGGYTKDGALILQADHLVSRSNSATYADTRLIVCVCKSHHGWKSVGSNLRKKLYDDLVRSILPKDRVELWDRCEEDSWRPTKMDWKMELAALQQQLKAA